MQTQSGRIFDKDDIDLAQAARRGDLDAFECLVRRHYTTVYAIAVSRLSNHDTAEDLTQEVFIRAHFHLKRSETPIEKLVAWLTVVTRNLAVDWQRKGRRASSILPLVLENEPAYDLADSRTPELACIDREQRESLARAVATLPPDQQQIVDLHFTHDLTLEAIAQRVGKHPTTVGRSLKKALMALREYFSNDPDMADGVFSAKGVRKTVRAVALINVLPEQKRAKIELLCRTVDPSQIALHPRGIRHLVSGTAATKAAIALGVLIVAALIFSSNHRATSRVVSPAIKSKQTRINAVAGATVVPDRAETSHSQRTYSQAATPVDSASTAAQSTDPEQDPAIHEAFGFATVYNVPRVEQFVAQALSQTSDPRRLGYLHWLRAYAYINFMVEYRTTQYREPYQADLDAIRRYAPSLLCRELPSRYSVFRFHVPECEFEKVPDLLKDLLADAERETPPDYRLCLQAHAYIVAASCLEEKDKARAHEMRNLALQALGEANKLRPELYDVELWYTDTLWKAGRRDEARARSASMLQEFQEKSILYADASPAQKQVAYLQEPSAKNSQPTQIGGTEELLKDLRNTWPNDPNMQLAYLDHQLAVDKPVLEEWEELDRKFEEGQFPPSRLRVRTRALYILGHLYAKANRLDEALSAYTRLQQYAPDYATVHVNKAILLMFMAQQEQDSAKKLQLQQEARHEAITQMSFDFHGTATEQANRILKQIDEQLNQKP